MGCTTSNDVQQDALKKPYNKAFTSQSLSAETFVSLKDGDIADYYIVKQTLGEGAFGCVKLVTHKVSKLDRAMKQLKKDSILLEDQVKLFNELEILKNLDHPNIVKIHELYQDKTFYYLITEYCEGGELFDRLSQVQSFSEKVAADYMKQLFQAVYYCHTKNIVHRDLKLENMLLENKKNESALKIIDFGTSRKILPQQMMQMRIGTLYYMAPEVFKANYDLKCDVWSCGVIMYILLCGYPPFNGTDDQIRSKIQSGTFQFDPVDWKPISQEAQDLISKMLIYDPKKRISIEECLKDEWIVAKAPSVQINTSVLKNLTAFYSKSKLRAAIQIFIISQVSTMKEKEELSKQFKAIDKNNDGTLSKEELLQCFLKTHTEKEAQDIVYEILKTADLDHSGKIDFTEFLVATTNREKMLSKQKLEQVFKIFDKDGDGKIQREELQEIMSGVSIDDQEWKHILEECDKDGDGEISLPELIILMQRF